MILCARSSSCSSEQSAKRRSCRESMLTVCLFCSHSNKIISLSHMTDMLFEKFLRCTKPCGYFLLDCAFRVLIGWEDKLRSRGFQFGLFSPEEYPTDVFGLIVFFCQMSFFRDCFQFQDNKAVNSGDEKRTTALQESIVNVACPIPEGDQDDMPWHFSLSVSNNGVQKSKPFMMTVFHSKCTACSKSGECKPDFDKVRNNNIYFCVFGLNSV